MKDTYYIYNLFNFFLRSQKYKLIKIQILYSYADKFIDTLHNTNEDFKNHFDGTGVNLQNNSKLIDIWYYPIPLKKAQKMKRFLTKKRFPQIHKIIYKDF